MPKAVASLIKLAVLVLVVGGAYMLFIHKDRVVLSPGVKAPFPPEQVNIDPLVIYEDDDYQVTAVAEFAIQAKVLGRERYRNGREADFSPIDLVLGWQRMSDQEVVDEIDVSQYGRWYRWETDRLPIPQRDIERCSANMHMVPKDDRVRENLLAVRTGEVIAIRGYLVDIWASGGWTWSTSRSRDDTGDGACEIVWVEAIEVVETE
jgi:hypothetical protein